MNIRCVVTGQDASGKSIFVRDSRVEPITLSLFPGYEFHRLWGSDSGPALPTDGAPPSQPRYFPPRHGFRFGFFTIPPNSVTRAERELLNTPANLQELQLKLPGMLDVLERDEPGMHTTDTIDYDVVVSGEVVLELDGGAEVHLKAGDCVIQNGTRHAWRNRSSQNCVIAVTLLGAERKR